MTKQEIAALSDQDLAEKVYYKMCEELDGLYEWFGECLMVDEIRNHADDIADFCDYIEYFDKHGVELGRSTLELMAGDDDIFPFLRETGLRWNPGEERVAEAFQDGIEYMRKQIEAYENAIKKEY